MTTREIVQLRAKDFHTAVYIGADDGTRYLVGTDNLCPDCTTPMIVLEVADDGDGAGTGALRTYHDVDCVIARTVGGPTLSETDLRRVNETRRRYLDESPEMWSELG